MIYFTDKFDESILWLGIQNISRTVFIESINGSIKKKETFPWSDGCFDEHFPIIEKNAQEFVLKWSYVFVRYGYEIEHFR